MISISECISVLILCKDLMFIYHTGTEHRCFAKFEVRVAYLSG